MSEIFQIIDLSADRAGNNNFKIDSKQELDRAKSIAKEAFIDNPEKFQEYLKYQEDKFGNQPFYKLKTEEHCGTTPKPTNGYHFLFDKGGVTVYFRIKKGKLPKSIRASSIAELEIIETKLDHFSFCNPIYKIYKSHILIDSAFPPSYFAVYDQLIPHKNNIFSNKKLNNNVRKYLIRLFRCMEREVKLAKLVRGEKFRDRSFIPSKVELPNNQLIKISQRKDLTIIIATDIAEIASSRIKQTKKAEEAAQLLEIAKAKNLFSLEKRSICLCYFNNPNISVFSKQRTAERMVRDKMDFMLNSLVDSKYFFKLPKHRQLALDIVKSDDFPASTYALIAALGNDTSIFNKAVIDKFIYSDNIGFISELLNSPKVTDKTKEYILADIKNRNQALLWRFKQYFPSLDSLRKDKSIGSGQSVTIAVMDDPVDPAHPEFLDKNSISRISIKNPYKKESNDTHGDFVAGLLSGNNLGIAPKSKIILYSGIAFEKVINDVIRRKQQGENIRVFNASFGFIFNNHNAVETYFNNIKRLEDNGILFVNATGFNRGQQVLKPNGYFFIKESKYKKICPSALFVGSYTNIKYPSGRTAKVLSSFSPIDSELYAPGEERISSATLVLKDGRRIYSYTKGDGISFAIPVVSGLAALLFEKHPDATPQQIKNLFLQSISGSIKFIDDGAVKKMFQAKSKQ